MTDILSCTQILEMKTFYMNFTFELQCCRSGIPTPKKQYPAVQVLEKCMLQPTKIEQLSWSKSVVLNHCFEGRMRLPSTLCAALSSLSIKPLIFCVTDFILQ